MKASLSVINSLPLLTTKTALKPFFIANYLDKTNRFYSNLRGFSVVSWEIYVVVVFLSKIQVLILENKDEQLRFICEIGEIYRQKT